MPTPFAEIKEADAAQLVRVPTWFDENRAFVYECDHWQGGKGFVGPVPTSTTLADAAEAIASGWAKGFTSENTLREVAERRRDGLTGNAPQFRVSVRRSLGEGEEIGADEEAAVAAMETALRAWYDSNQCITWLPAHSGGEARRVLVGGHELMKDVALATCAYEVTYLRIRIPAARTPASGFATPEDALKAIFVEHITRDQAVLHTDEDTLYRLGIVRFQREEDTVLADGTAGKITVDYAELHYLDPDRAGASGDPLAVMRYDYASAGAGAEIDADLRGALLLREVRGQLLVTAQMREQQRAYNTASTEMRIVNDQEGFPETILLNTRGPGEEKLNDDGEYVFVPEPYSRGPGQRSFMLGDPIYGDPNDPNRVTGYATPSVSTIPAAAVTGYEAEMATRRASMLRQAKQSFVEITGDAVASGESRIQAMMDFMQDLQDEKAPLDLAGTWLLETVWYLACDLAGTPGRDFDLRVDFDLRIATPHIPASLRGQILDEVIKGALSMETALSMLGHDEPEAELERIRAGESYLLDMLRRRAEVVGLLSSAGAGLENAALVAGVEADQARTLGRMDTVVGGDGR